MHMADLENILTWEKASGYPKNNIRGNTGLMLHTGLKTELNHSGH